MKKYIAIAALAVMLCATAKPANANAILHSSSVPVGLKIAVFLVGAMTMSTMLNAMVISNQQKRQLTVEEAQYAAFLPFLWIVRPLALPPPAKKGRR